MSSIMDIARLGSLGTQSKENNKELVADVTKLCKIVEMLVAEYSSFIIEVRVSPIKMMRQSTSDLKELNFYIVYNLAEGDSYAEVTREIKDILNSLVCDEFEGVDSIRNIVFSSSCEFKEPTLCLYSQVVPDVNLIKENKDIYTYIKDIALSDNVNISIASTYPYESGIKTMFIHCDSIVRSTVVTNDIKKICMKYNCVASDLDHTEKYTNIVFDILYGKKEIGYDMPYVLFTPKMFIDEDMNNENSAN